MKTNANDIAVIGIGCRFPDADSGDELYENLLTGKDSLREIPEARWGFAELYSREGEKNRISSKWGGFITGIEEFDARFFKILPSEADLLDPQQKLFLTCSWEALEDAGYARRKATAGRPVGVYAGVTWNEFSLYANEYGYLRGLYRGAGSLYWGIPNRVSYFFDFLGPSIAIDTACSSSLVAVHLAIQGLRSGECEMALAGGVNLNLHPAKYLFLSSASFLSTEGKCRGFGEGGDGYVPSEGVGVLVLKTLAAAQRDGDRIYGLIKGSATNHGGKATGYTVPNPRAHQAVIRSALDRAGISPRDIGYVECHGTGTELGDPIEIAGLRIAFEQSTRDRQFCGIGTVKSNIGHCEAAAGVAGLIKVLLSMRDGVIPATLHAETPNRKIDFANSPFYLVQENQPWTSASGSLLAGVSSFGAGGSNSHCILQSVPSRRSPRAGPRAVPYAVPISATNPERTAAYCLKLKDFIRGRRDVLLADLSRSLGRREAFSHRVVFLVDSIDALAGLLERHAADRSNELLYVSDRLDPSTALASLQEWAEAWIRAEADLSGLPVAGDGRLVSVPGYAFEKTRSWIHPSAALYRKHADAVSVLHPLVDANISTASQGVFGKRLHRYEYFVDEHWVMGDPVLPGVCLVEMALFCSARYLEAPQAVLSDIWFLEPIALGDRDTVDIQVGITSASSALRFEIRTAAGASRHATGKILARPGEAPLDTRGDIDPGTLLSRCARTLSKEDFYERFARSGIVQKGRFTGVSEFHCNDTEAIALLTLLDDAGDRDRFGLHPALMDGAVQTAMMHLFQLSPETGTVLPFQVGACMRHRPLESPAYAVATLKDPESRKYDILICSLSGSPLAELRDFVLKEYTGKEKGLRPLLFAPTSRKSAPPPIPAHPGGPPVSVFLLTAGRPLEGSPLPPGWSLATWNGLAPGAITPFPRDGEGRAPAGIALVIGGLDSDGSGLALFSSLQFLARRLFDFIQAIAKSQGSVDVVVCIRDDSAAGTALARACLGLIKSLNLELAGMRLRLLELGDAASDAELYQRIRAELQGDPGDVYVCYRDGNRLVHELRELVPPPVPAGSRAEPCAWIVSGAGGGLGMAVTRHLLERGEQVAMVGRSALSDASRSLLRAFASDRWEYIQCDLTRPGQVESAVAHAVERFRGPWGLVHCAGVLRDGPFLNKKWDDFKDVATAKIQSLLLLCDNLAQQDLRRIVLFSSLSALMGNRGQSDYAFANGFLDGFSSLAGRLIASDPIVSSIDWPYWAEGGMRIADGKLRTYVETFLSEPLPSNVGLELIDRVMASGPLCAAVVYGRARIGDLEKRLRLKPLSASGEPAEARDIRSPFSRAVSTEGGDNQPDGYGARATSQGEDATRRARFPYPNPVPEGDHGVAPPARELPDRKRAIQAYLARFLERELNLELTEDDLNIDFSDLGMDSITQMDLITALEKERRFRDLPQTLFADNATILALTDFFYHHHREADYDLKPS